MASSANHFADRERRKKVIAMVAALDRNFVKQNPRVDPHDQAGRILLASHKWSDAVWLLIAKNAGYKREKTPGKETRRLVREVYEGRATAPLQRRNAS
jgi:hypothetical protein